MASLLALLSENRPNLQTRKGLIILGLQNDFTSPAGKLPVDMRSGFLDRIRRLVPHFREFGDVIWIRSEYDGNREVNSPTKTGDAVIAGARATPSRDGYCRQSSKRGYEDCHPAPSKRARQSESSDDEELFLTRTSQREPGCVRGSWGADFPPEVKNVIDSDKDLQLVKSSYSAFSTTSLLLTLRSRLVTELFVCGCLTNLSVFATAMDAARHGIHITLVEDCLGYRKRGRHDEAVRQLVSVMGADVKDSRKVLETLRNPPTSSDEEDEGDEEDEDSSDESIVAPKQTIVYTAKGHHIIEVANDLIADDSQDEDEEVELPNLTRDIGRRSSDPYDTSASIPRRKAGFPPPREVASSASLNGLVKSKISGLLQPSAPRSPSGILSTSKSTTEGRANPRDSSGLDQAMGRGLQLSDTKAFPPAQQPSALVCPAAPIVTIPANMDVDNQNASALSPSLIRKPLFGEDKVIESANSRMIYNLLPLHLAETVFSRLEAEVNWQHMYHQTGAVPRLVCCQGDIAADGSHPVYRHPTDHTLPLQSWTPTVDLVREAAEAVVGHPLNHALIQLYRSGEDFISEHSDKTLDILHGSNIVNVSFGAQRTMRLRTKRGAPHTPQIEHGSVAPSPLPRTTYRIPLPHNSLLLMSLETNSEYLHGINADKRPDVEITPPEKACGGKRISLTFRQIATFLTADEKKIWGQGATGKTREEAREVINGDKEESEKVLRGFGAENQSSKVSWASCYGAGSDVLHLKVERKEG